MPKSPRDQSPPLFQSFFMGGFECATHQRRDRKRIDVITSTRHEHLTLHDYELVHQAGIRTVRDGLRWHLIETSPGMYDWSSFLAQLNAAAATGMQVIWDICHWGVPSDVDILSDQFPLRFAAFAQAAAVLIRDHNLRRSYASAAFYCPINEMSFWSGVGGDEGAFHPFFEGQGPAMKRQLAAASIKAIEAIRSIDPTARFVQAEPIIHISADQESDTPLAAAHTASQYEAWDMLAGTRNPELGGTRETLDLIGVNYYWNNQWIHEGDRTPPGHRQHRPLHRMLHEIWQRYRRPILVTETGAELGADIGWLGYVCAEVRQAQRMQVPVLGICLYPIMDYPGWDDDRHCRCGMIEASLDWSERRLRSDLCEELHVQEQFFTRT